VYVTNNHKEEIMNVEDVDLKGNGHGYLMELALHYETEKNCENS
jgi:hypothetical protein